MTADAAIHADSFEKVLNTDEAAALSGFELDYPQRASRAVNAKGRFSKGGLGVSLLGAQFSSNRLPQMLH